MEILNLSRLLNKTFEIYNPELEEQNNYYNCFADEFEFKCIDTDYPDLICKITIKLFYTNSIYIKYECKDDHQKEDWYQGKLKIPESLLYGLDKDTAYAIYKGIRRINNSFVN